jgi:hypothetical protein
MDLINKFKPKLEMEKNLAVQKKLFIRKGTVTNA